MLLDDHRLRRNADFPEGCRAHCLRPPRALTRDAPPCRVAAPCALRAQERTTYMQVLRYPRAPPPRSYPHQLRRPWASLRETYGMRQSSLHTRKVSMFERVTLW